MVSKIRKAAEGQACLVRLPKVCSFNPEKTILAHKNGYGLAKKYPDFIAAFCCADCHDVVDGKVHVDWLTKEEIQLYFYEGVFRTQLLLHDQKYILTPGSK